MKAKSKQMSREERTAYHEAGHVVAATFLRFGHKPKKATIIPTEDYLGVVHPYEKRAEYPEYDLDAKTQIKWEHTLIGYLAGLVAEKIAAGRYNYRGAHSDMQVAQAIVEARSGDGESGALYYRWAKARTKELLQARWQYVERVADALMQHKTLNSRQIREAMFGEKMGQDMEDLSKQLGKIKPVKLPTLPAELSKRSLQYCYDAFIILDALPRSVWRQLFEEIYEVLGGQTIRLEEMDSKTCHVKSIDKELTVLKAICLLNVACMREDPDNMYILNIRRNYWFARRRYLKSIGKNADAQ